MSLTVEVRIYVKRCHILSAGRQTAPFRLQRRPVAASSITTLQPSDIVPAMQHLKTFPHGGCPPAAIIFDLDGTLTETELLKVKAAFVV